MSQTSHYFSHKQGERGILLTFSRDTVGGDARVGYRSWNSKYSSQILDSRGDGVINGSRY